MNNTKKMLDKLVKIAENQQKIINKLAQNVLNNNFKNELKQLIVAKLPNAKSVVDRISDAYFKSDTDGSNALYVRLTSPLSDGEKSQVANAVKGHSKFVGPSKAKIRYMEPVTASAKGRVKSAQEAPVGNLPVGSPAGGAVPMGETKAPPITELKPNPTQHEPGIVVYNALPKEAKEAILNIFTRSGDMYITFKKGMQSQTVYDVVFRTLQKLTKEGKVQQAYSLKIDNSVL